MQKSQPTAAQKNKASRWTILDLLQWTTPYFKSHDIESPRVAAEILLAHALGLRRIDLYLRYDQPMGAEELSRYKELIKRRVNREPVAYIVGTREFWSLELSVNRHVLIPRPETECLVEQVLPHLPEASDRGPLNVLELGTGSGAIVLALASERTNHRFFASDRSEDALRLARLNAEKRQLSQRIHFFLGDWLSPLQKRTQFQLIVSNPPYIPTKMIPKLAPEIYLHEPESALDGGESGLSCLEALIGQAPGYLAPGGFLFLEIGYDQGAAVEAIGKKTGQYESIGISKDYSGHDRVASFRKG